MKMRLLKKQKEWIELLKTQIRPNTKKTKFGQYRFDLVDSTDKNFCCLGVCERFVMNRSYKEIETEAFLLPNTLKALRFRDKKGSFKKPNKKEFESIKEYSTELYNRIVLANLASLSSFNDHGITFKEIAWFVENFPHLVFKKLNNSKSK